MAFKQFTVPPDTRVVGQPNPPVDDNGLADTVNALGGAFSPLNTQFGVCDPSGVSDSTVGINAALLAAAAIASYSFTFGGKCLLVAGLYQTSAPIINPPGVSLRGDGGNRITTYNDMLPGTTIQPSATWTATTIGLNTFYGAISFIGQTVASPNYGGQSEEQRLYDIHIDCHLVPGSTLIDGVQEFGNVRRTYCENVSVAYCTGIGFNWLNDSGGNGPDAPWRFNCQVRNSTLQGVVLNRISDANLDMMFVENAGIVTPGADGYTITNASNGRVTNCRAEHCGFQGVGNGFTHIARSNITGSGGIKYVGCSTDRNEAYGMFIESTNAQTTPVEVVGCNFRRDGRNNGTGGGNLAGIFINAFPGTVLLTGVNVFPGVADGGTETNSPQIGLKLSGNTQNLTYVLATACYFHGNTTGISDDGTAQVKYAACVQATGGTAGPTVTPLGMPAAGEFGTGLDGIPVLDGVASFGFASGPSSNVYTLTRDLHVTAMVINSGVTLKTGNYRIFCLGGITGAGNIDNSGANATGQPGGSSGSSTSFIRGQPGGGGGTGVSGAGTGGAAANIGGTGGAGGTGTSGASGAGGAVNNQSYAIMAANVWKLPHAFFTSVCNYANATFGMGVGAGGGGGGSDASSVSGGGGGQGGGIVFIMAYIVVLTGTISANGGNGFTTTSGNTGGGGGGAGGVVAGYTILPWSVTTISTAGGSPGSGHGTGTAGSAGSAGTSFNQVLV